MISTAESGRPAVPVGPRGTRPISLLLPRMSRPGTTLLLGYLAIPEEDLA